MSVRDEYTDYNTYLALSRREKNPAFKKALEELAQQERDHYEFWRKYAPDTSVGTNRLSLYFVLVLRIILGLTFTMKFLERHEDAVISRYKQVAGSIPTEDRTRFDAMVNDEEHHESYFRVEPSSNFSWDTARDLLVTRDHSVLVSLQELHRE